MSLLPTPGTFPIRRHVSPPSVVAHTRPANASEATAQPGPPLSEVGRSVIESEPLYSKAWISRHVSPSSSEAQTYVRGRPACVPTTSSRPSSESPGRPVTKPSSISISVRSKLICVVS